MIHHRVCANTESRDVTAYVPAVIPVIASRKGVCKALKSGRLLLNGCRCRSDYVPAAGDEITFTAPIGVAKVFPLELKVVFQDASLAVVVKPPGFWVNGNRYRTVENALPFNLKQTHALDALPCPRAVHRLDAPTSGLLVVAKTASALVSLSRQFQLRTVQKRYHAIVSGRTLTTFDVDIPIEGRSATTRFRRVVYTRSVRSNWLTTVAAEPVSGRTHQIRRHLQYAGYPVFGDHVYNSSGSAFRGKGLFLSAVAIAFSHPATGKRIEFATDEPPKFESLRRRESRRWHRLHSDIPHSASLPEPPSAPISAMQDTATT